MSDQDLIETRIEPCRGALDRLDTSAKPKPMKRVSKRMLRTLEIAEKLFRSTPDLARYAECLEQIRRILTHQDGWVIFHRSLVKELTSSETTTELVFSGRQADDIEAMYFVRETRSERERREDKVS